MTSERLYCSPGEWEVGVGVGDGMFWLFLIVYIVNYLSLSAKKLAFESGCLQFDCHLCDEFTR